MKPIIAILLATYLCSAISNAEVIKQDIAIQLGAKSFHEGDVVSITEVKSTSDKIEIGDTVTIKGRYRLDSKDTANLLLSVTRTKTAKAIEIDKSQMIKATKGWHEFEMSVIIKHTGLLHLTFYTEAGKPFGGVYFGTADQTKELKQISIAHYKKNG